MIVVIALPWLVRAVRLAVAQNSSKRTPEEPEPPEATRLLDDYARL